jgi:Mn-dependent DtxR family transcriptional regulator
MSQDEILRVLEKSKKPLRINEIAKKLKKGSSSVSSCLRRLRNNREIKFIYDNKGRFLYYV